MRIFIGYDSKEPIAYHVLAHSIMRRASKPVSIQPVMLSQLHGVYNRKRGETESTEFSLSRFLVPWLCGYQGDVLFLDSDMLCLTDITTMPSGISAVSVCQHEYTPRQQTKFLGQTQTTYERKNWSSLMRMDAAQCRALSPYYVNEAGGLELHRFRWLDDRQIGSIHLEWNWLVGEYDHNPDAKILHFTNGGPWFHDYRECDGADLWRAELKHMLDCGPPRRYL